MPIYDYKCQSCSKVFEKISSFSMRESPRECECGGHAELQVSAPRSVHGGFFDNVTRPRAPDNHK